MIIGRKNLVLGLTCASALVGCVDMGTDGVGGVAETERVGVAKQAIIATCPADLPKLPVPVDFDKELVIRSLAVVEDPCRTSWTGTGCPAFNPSGYPASRTAKWTFGWMMTVMSGSLDPTSVTARQFTANWLNSWLVNTNVGTPPNVQSVVARSAIQKKLISGWQIASGCVSGSPIVGVGACLLDLKKAPFRLLAMVNRVDMSGGGGYNQPPGTPGEFRFVFGAIDTSTSAINAGFLNATAVLEYKLPTTKTSLGWATVLHQLSSASLPLSALPSPGTTQFADSLQAITDTICGPSAQAGKPNNGSTIGQIRTNELDFDSTTPLGSRQWEMRQFALPCTSGTCQLAQTYVTQTPPTAWNNAPKINDFLVANQVDLMSASHVVPDSLLGGSSLSPPPPTSPLSTPTIWEAPNPIVSPLPDVSPADARHLFAFSTCNGCHYAETANTSRFHISPRKAGAVSSLSGFLGFSNSLVSSDDLTPNYALEVPDPDVNNEEQKRFLYNEPWRRACEIRRILANRFDPVTRPAGHAAPPSAPPPSSPPSTPPPTGGGGGGCFVAGTPISMADGSTRPIEDVKTGDQILAYDVDSGRIVSSVVTETFVHPDIEGTVLINGRLRATANHPVYANGRWVRADELSVGDHLLLLPPPDGGAEQLSSGALDSSVIGEVAALVILPGAQTTFNLEVANQHDYFASGFLVHNKFPTPLEEP